MVEQLLPELRQKLDLPFAIFGHSMGAVLAAEVSKALAAADDPMPDHLFVSGRRPPHLPSPDPPFHHLPDDQFVDEIERRYGGIPAEVRREAELMALLVPGLRADMTALETFDPRDHRPLSCPISAFGGSDDPRTPREHLNAWRQHTTAAFRVRVFQGGHFYINDRRSELLGDIASTLAPMIASARAESAA